MIKIEVKSNEVVTKSGVSARTNKPYSIREQVGVYAFLCDRDGKPNPYPTRITISLRDEQQPYDPGLYVVAPESFYVDRFNALSLGIVLRPMGQAGVKAAA